MLLESLPGGIVHARVVEVSMDAKSKSNILACAGRKPCELNGGRTWICTSKFGS